MMGMPSGPGAAGKKLYFFKLVEVEPRKFEAKLRAFIKNPEEWEMIVQKVKTILEASGELLEVRPATRTFLFKVPEENANAFMEVAMREACIFRF
jgi:hypothetical protein